MPELPDITKPASDVAGGVKGSLKRMMAFAKKRPAIVALMVGGVVVLVWAMRRSGGFGRGAARGEGDPLLELGASGVPIEEDLGGFLPGAYPAPVPYYEPIPYPDFEPYFDPYYAPGPAYQDIDYGASQAMAGTLSPFNALLVEAVLTGQDVFAPIAFGPEPGFQVTKRQVDPRRVIEGSAFSGAYGAGDLSGIGLIAPGEPRKGTRYAATEEISKWKQAAATLRNPVPRATSIFRRRPLPPGSTTVPKLTPKPTGTQVPKPGEVPRGLRLMRNVPI